MKRFCITAVAALLCAAVCITCVALDVNKAKTAVEFKENIYHGERAAAYGVTVENRVHFQNHLFWDTKLVIGKENKVKSEFDFSAVERDTSYFILNEVVHLYNDIGTGCDYSRPASEQWGISRAQKHSFDAMEYNSEATFTYFVKDYYKYYPINVHIDLPTVKIYDDVSGTYTRVQRAFEEFFKIPVKETDYVRVQMAKDENGRNISTSEEMYSYVFSPISAYTADRCFFAISNRSNSDDTLMDMSLIKGGYGIYSFSYDADDHKLYNGINAESLKTAFPLEESVTVEHLSVSEDNKKLLVYSREGTSVWLTVINISDMKQLQKIYVGSFEGIEIFDYKDFSVVSGDEYFTLLSCRSGEYGIEFSCEHPDFEDIGKSYGISDSDSMAFDGERLVYVGNAHTNYMDTCNFFVRVFTKSGLVYYAVYESSLQKAGEKSDYSCKPVAPKANTVKFTK